MRIKAIVTNPDYTGVIVNTARVSVNGENPVTITEGGVVVTKPVTEFRKTVYNPNSGTYGAGLDITTNYDGIIEYRIDFKLPTDTTSYSSIEILDILPGVLELANTVETAENVRIYIDGVDITEASKVSYANGVVGYRLGEGNDFVSLAGKTVVMNVSTRLKQGVSSGTAYNTARVLVNGKNPQNVSGGELNITNPPPIIPGALVSLTKKIYSYDDNEYVDSSYVTDPDEILRYQISFVLPSDMAGYESLEIQDVLPDSLGLYGLIEDSVVIAVNGIAVSGGRLDMKYADIGGGVISYAFDTAAIAALGGKVVTMTIMTKLLPDVVNGSVINKGRVLINEDPGDPTRPGDAPVSPSREVDGPDVIRIDSAKDFSKKVWDGKGYADSFVVPDMDQDLSYQISFVLPADIGGYRSIEIQDLLPSMLELTDSLTDSVIVEVNGVKANENGLSVKYPDSGGGVISYVFSQSEISSMANALVTMTIKTRLVSGAAYGSIENIARLLINEDVGAPTKPEDTPEEPSEEVKGPTVEIYPEYTVIFNGNEGHVVGSTVEYARYPDYMVDSLPRAERTNYRFVEWNSRRDGSGYTFDDETPVSEDITVYALWQYIKPDITDTPGNGEGDDPAPPKTPVVTPAPIEKPPEEVPLQEIQDEPAPLEDAPVAAAVPTPPARTRTAAVVNEEPPIEIIEPIWITPPTISLPDIATPLAMAIPVWSLLNLMLAMLGCLIAIMLLVTSVRRRQDEYEEYRSVQESKFLKILWRVLGILSGLAGLVVFMLTENISNVMVMTDRWTPLMIMIEFAVLVFTFLLYRRGSDKDTDDGVMFDLSE
jgi:fimbrial isopeptide formation D2 family protein